MTMVVVILAVNSLHASGSLLATYIGGNGKEGWQYTGAVDLAIAGDGTVYVIGVTSSGDFPVTPGAYVCPGRGMEDFFIARFSPDLATLLQATVIGGSNNETSPQIALTSDGTVYISGATLSTNFPTTVGAYDRTASTLADIFVARFNSELTTLQASTLLGGNGHDDSGVLAIDADGNVLVAGQTRGGSSNTFPTTAGAYDRTANPYYTDFFVSKLNASLTSLLASTFLGGRYNELWPGLALDAQGNIFVSGASESDNYPTTLGAYCETYHGTPSPGAYIFDVVVSKLSSDLTTLQASTYVGTDHFEVGSNTCVDPDGNVFVAGHTDGLDYPVTPGAYDEVHNGSNEFVVTKLNNDLTNIVASTYFTPDEVGFMYSTSQVCDEEGNLLMVGNGWTEVPVTSDAYDATHNGADETGDCFVRSMSGGLTTLSYGSYLGGAGEEFDAAVVVSADGVLYIAGYTASEDFPVSSTAFDRSYNGGAGDAFVARLDRRPPCCVGRVGDANGSGEDEPTIGDVSVLIDAKFITGACDGIVACVGEADVNQSGGPAPFCDDITIGDISVLIDYLFITGLSLGLPACLTNGSSVDSGSVVTIDGVMQPGEWDDVTTVALAVPGRVDVTVSFKHDGTNLLVAYNYDFVGAEGLCMPEIFIDSDANGGTTWMPDDLWFHVSGTDCEARGSFGVYTDCSVVQPDWQAVPNFALVADPPPLDTFEVAIPFSKLGITAGDTIGLAFRVELMPSLFGYWPNQAMADSPGTWGRAVIRP